jgi:lysozyme
MGQKLPYPIFNLNQMQFKFSDNLVTLLAEFEGFRSKPYLDSVNIPTIGYGTIRYPNGTKVTMLDKEISKETAKEYLLDHANKIALPAINSNIKVEQTQNQIDALGSLIYNIGTGGFANSTVLKRINAKDSTENIKEAWYRWNKAGGSVIPGLTKRREKEFNFYIKK